MELYGISIHKSGVAIGGHGKTDQKSQYAFHATFNDVSVPVNVQCGRKNYILDERESLA